MEKGALEVSLGFHGGVLEVALVSSGALEVGWGALGWYSGCLYCVIEGFRGSMGMGP